MKHEDIPKLIFVGSQGVSWDLDGIEPTLERFEKSYGIDLDPDFQRGHVWDMPTKIRFVEYILRGGVVPPIRFNSPEFGGQSRSKLCDLPETIVLVDGKQRLSALREFINGEFPVFGKNYLNDFDDPLRTLRGASGLSYLVNKLQTRKELLQWYLELNEGQVAHTAEELERVKKLLILEK